MRHSCRCQEQGSSTLETASRNPNIEKEISCRMERQPDEHVEPSTQNADYIFRLAQETDFPGIVQFFKRHNFGPTDLECLRWKYLKNPDGQALIYVAEDSGGAIVCTIVHLPRLFASAKTGTFLMWENIDMLVDAKLRGQRIYSRLGNLVRSRRDYMMMGFPNEFSARTIKKKTDTVIPLEEWRFPVSMGKSIAKKSHGIAVRFTLQALCRLLVGAASERHTDDAGREV